MPHFDHFDFLAPLYEKVIPGKEPEEFWRLASLPTNGSVLDAGGGTGRVAQHLIGKADQVVIADLSCGMLKEAGQKSGLAPVCSATEDLPFQDGTFSRVIMVDALHHVVHQADTIRDLWRMLQPGGILLIEEPDIRKFGVVLIAIMEKVFLMRSHFLSPPKIAELIQFSDAEVRIEQDGATAYIIAKKRVG